MIITSARPPAGAALDFEAIFRSMPTPFVVLDRDLRFIAANQSYLAMTGRTVSALIGNHVFDAFPEAPERQDLLQQAFGQALAGVENSIARLAFVVERPGKDRVDSFWNVHHTPVCDLAGAVIGVLQHVQDVTAEVEAERMREVISQEYDHRVRNLMARVSAIARQSARHDHDADKFLADFDRRIVAMAATHELLLQGGWDRLSLQTLVERTVQPNADGHDRVGISGTDEQLSSRVGQALGMALHELATNAARHGALRDRAGRLTIVWTRTADQGLRIEWQESGVAYVPTAITAGFGTTIIDRVLPLEAAGTVERSLTPTGLVCTIVIPDPQRV